MDPASLTAVIMAALSLIGAGWSQIEHCRSGCCEIDKKSVDKQIEIVREPAAATAHQKTT